MQKLNAYVMKPEKLSLRNWRNRNVKKKEENGIIRDHCGRSFAYYFMMFLSRLPLIFSFILPFENIVEYIELWSLRLYLNGQLVTIIPLQSSPAFCELYNWCINVHNKYFKIGDLCNSECICDAISILHFL